MCGQGCHKGGMIKTDHDAKAVIAEMIRATGRAEFAEAAVESIAQQIVEVLVCTGGNER